MNVPLIDLRAQYRTIAAEVQQKIEEVLTTTRFIGGAEVKSFEAEFAAFCGVDHAVACGNGTDALELVLDAWGIGPGDEVIVPAVSWISTSEVVATRGATPVFVDIDPDTNCLDLEQTRAALTPRTRAIILVHLYGYPAPAAAFRRLADEHGCYLIEDSAQAHGAITDGRTVGSVGHAATFSFFPSKSLGAYGDGGCVVTDDGRTAATVRALANHGMPGRRHVHTLHGRNSRLDSLQAAVLRVKLRHLPAWLAQKRTLAERYADRLEPLTDGGTSPSVRLPPWPGGDSRHGAHLFAPRFARRNDLADYLRAAGVATAVHYPTPLPLHVCYGREAAAATDYPVARALSSETLSLPLYAELPPQRVDDIADLIHKFYGA